MILGISVALAVQLLLVNGGIAVLAALDSSVLFSLPFALDAAVVPIVARHRDMFWLYPLIVVPPSLVRSGRDLLAGVQARREGLQHVVSAKPLETRCYTARMPPKQDSRVSQGSLRQHTHDIEVETACPLDCPDSCSLNVKVNGGRVVSIDGSRRQPVTGGYICAKVRAFPDRLYGAARIARPMTRIGAKGHGPFAHIGWDEAIPLLASRLSQIRDRWGGEAILPFSYGGSNGLLSQDTTDARLFGRLGASRLARTVCAAPTSAALGALYGKMPSVAYDDYPTARLIVVWGANPSASGIHLVPYIREAQRAGARLVVVDPRSTPLARTADLHLAVRPGSDVAVALAVHRFLLEEGGADAAFLAEHTRGGDTLRERALPWTFDRAAEVAGVEPAALRRLAEWYRDSSPAVIRCGWGLERNRNGGSAALAVLALPAVAGKFGVRGGGYTMSSSGAFQLDRSRWMDDQPATRTINMNELGRVLTEAQDPPVKALFVYNCNPAVTIPDQNRVIRGLERDDLFTVVFDQVFTDTAAYADLVLPATTFLEGYDIAKAYGPIGLQLVQPVVDAVGEARSNSEVFGQLISALGLDGERETQGDLDVLMQVLEDLPPDIADQLRETRYAVPAHGRTPVQFRDVFPRTPDGKVDLYPAHLAEQAGGELYAFRPDPGTDQFPLALISPACDKTISSTLGELPRPEATLLMHPQDASARDLLEGDVVRIVNERGEVQCPVSIAPAVRPGTVVLPKGLWRKSTRNGSTATALAPDSLTDFAGGACFNDARVEVMLLERKVN